MQIITKPLGYKSKSLMFPILYTEITHNRSYISIICQVSCKNQWYSWSLTILKRCAVVSGYDSHLWKWGFGKVRIRRGSWLYFWGNFSSFFEALQRQKISLIHIDSNSLGYSFIKDPMIFGHQAVTLDYTFVKNSQFGNIFTPHNLLSM